MAQFSGTFSGFAAALLASFGAVYAMRYAGRASSYAAARDLIADCQRSALPDDEDQRMSSKEQFSVLGQACGIDNTVMRGPAVPCFTAPGCQSAKACVCTSQECRQTLPNLGTPSLCELSMRLSRVSTSQPPRAEVLAWCSCFKMTSTG
eukprot:TRINITY_DN18579_c0_g1_i2.p1 TRINITY_DN18579_c0_g1~~TRINITY_DN18579_c0_g1_i2.p1  ORF type:complete len:149 (+),score=5.99 TRINITY_DN18579_c0_g1_i2:237-683(+)